VALLLYFDHQFPRPVAIQLRLRSVDVLTAEQDGAARTRDPALLDRATSLGRVLVTADADLLAEASMRQRTGVIFAGVIYVHQLDLAIGRCVADLELIAKATGPEEVANQVTYLPL
jgi:predicted nuclease of predicted toxin-antitoxin system